MKLHVFKEIEELILALAKHIYEISEKSIKEKGSFNFVLSGGNSPKKLYELMASEEFRNKYQWDKFYFFFGDERFVNENSSDSNFKMAKESLFNPLKIQSENIFQIDTSLKSPELSAQKYMKTLKNHFQKNEIQFDFILLGLGDDGHTASLFPHSDILNEKEKTFKAVHLDKQKIARISISAPLINYSKHIAFLVYGKDKAKAIYHILEDISASSDSFPARLINFEENKVEWFLDQEAAQLLKNKNIFNS